MPYDIIDEGFKKQIIFLLNNNWTGKTDLYFPMQKSIYIERKNIKKLFNYDYNYYKKDTLNSKKAVLFFFIDSEGCSNSVIILKDLTIIKFELEISDDYYYGSIFEISYTDTKIIVYDSFMISGNKINTSTFRERFLEAELMISNIARSEIEIELAYTSTNILNIHKNMNESEEIFMIPDSLPILTGINFSYLKWKSPEKITFSLQVFEEESDLILYSSNFKKLIRFCKINHLNDNGKSQIDIIKSLENYKDGCVIDMNVDFNTSNVFAENVDIDKIYPTSIRIIEKLLNIKREDIKIEELY